METRRVHETIRRFEGINKPFSFFILFFIVDFSLRELYLKKSVDFVPCNLRNVI